MTLEELELRVRAAFPGAILFDEIPRSLTVRLDGTHHTFVATPLYDDLLVITPDRRSTLDGLELERRIRDVTAHALIAARRRQLSGAGE